MPPRRTPSTSGTPVTPRRSSRQRSSSAKPVSPQIAIASVEKVAHSNDLPIEQITLFRHPFITLKAFSAVVGNLCSDLVRYLSQRKTTCALVFACVAIAAAVGTVEGPHQFIYDIFFEALWWLLLGFASSCGLGTGMHTFLLYLGPFIAKTTMAAYTCQSTDFATRGANAFVCLSRNEDVTFLAVFLKVQFQCMMWGAGTAIGELPPYFVARAARLSGRQTNEEIDELMTSESRTWRDSLTKFSFSLLQKFGFWGILVFASVPNPLFDLAGLTSGHFLIPFATFFTATLIGKGLIKVTIQSVLVVLVFSEQQLQALLALLSRVASSWEPSVSATLSKYKEQFSDPNAAAATQGSGIFSTIWAVVLTSMILFFVVSLVDASAQKYLRDQQQAVGTKPTTAVVPRTAATTRATKQTRGRSRERNL
eukprot:TRINITY_DN4604_c0_g1_i1.p1 TRINITY_DN4604_c0_g1~~TRINITY_DN4604_c0_g1_i1.p1  ORF type:complete len:423 (+),score=67.77 TRINITY_DN4604_c0_g1_i1:55-1323(+)